MFFRGAGRTTRHQQDLRLGEGRRQRIARHPVGRVRHVAWSFGLGQDHGATQIAEFEDPDSGTIHLGEDDITHLPPFDRDVNTVFQDYALFPHMTAQANVEYGLRTRKMPKEQR